VLIVAVTLVVYARALAGGFTYDDGLVIGKAQQFLQSGRLEVLFSRRYFGASFEGTWRPVVTLSYMIDAAIAMHPAVFHLDSIAWHAGSAILVTALARRLLPEGRRRFALVAGLLFALHPVATEAVDNAGFREDELATFFTLATLLLALGGRHPVAALATYGLALLSKESAVVAPVLLLGIRIADDRRSLTARALARELAPYAAVTAAYLAIRFGPMRTAGEYARYPGGSLGAALLGMPAVWAHDLRLLVAPWPLCADYPGFFAFGRAALPGLALGVAVVAAYVGVTVAAARRGQRVVALGLAWFGLALAPVSNLIPIPVPAAERFLYLPLAGIALAVAAAAGSEAAARRGVAAAGLLALAAFAVLVNLRHAVWHDNQALWSATLAVNPRSCGAHSAVGGDLLAQGLDLGTPELLREAAAHEQLALALCGEHDDPSRAAIMYTRLGAARAALGDLGPARVVLERAIALMPRNPLAVVWLGYVRFMEGDKQAAAVLLGHAVVDLGPPDRAVAEVAARYMDRL
jgi:hypothetical protein